MTFSLGIVLALLSFVFLLDSLSDLLSLTRMKDPLPTEFVGVYEPEKYQRALSYQSDNLKFDLISRTLSFVLSVGFILMGGFGWLDQSARSFGLNPILTGLLFAGILMLIRFLVSLPFVIYETFVLEERYGFNKSTPGLFVSDLVKGAVLSILLGAPLFAGILYFLENTGQYGWFYAWLAFTVFQIILMYLAPAVIMPLFNRFTPLPEGSLRDAIAAYANQRGFRLSGIFTMDSSKRSTKTNAFFTGFGRHRKLVLFDSLVEKHSIGELVAVLAHEIGHFERKHIVKSLVLSVVSSFMIFFTFSLALNEPSLTSAFQVNEPSVYASLVFLGILYSPILRVLSIFTQMLSRKHEFEADDFAAQTYGRPDLLITALKKLSMDNLAHLTPHPLRVLLDYSHPPILDRIRVLQRKPIKQ